MPTTTLCPHCGRRLRINAGVAGPRLKCPGCGEPFDYDPCGWTRAERMPAPIIPPATPAPFDLDEAPPARRQLSARRSRAPIWGAVALGGLGLAAVVVVLVAPSGQSPSTPATQVKAAPGPDLALWSAVNRPAWLPPRLPLWPKREGGTLEEVNEDIAALADRLIEGAAHDAVKASWSVGVAADLTWRVKVAEWNRLGLEDRKAAVQYVAVYLHIMRGKGVPLVVVDHTSGGEMYRWDGDAERLRRALRHP